ncbi:hypothetical protein KKF91_17085 [Myxococcota bacterium]|nr:hypothetical protein [Myxococcota bacterium]MBU1432254.1 hypothetical protein [Myxococcota bacterium]
MSLLLLAALGLAAPPAAPPAAAPPLRFFEVTLGQGVEAVKAAFKPVGRAVEVRWSPLTQEDGLSTLSFDCEAKRRCFALPSQAEFVFHEGRLITAHFNAESERAPEGISALHGMLKVGAAAGLGQATISQNRVGRRVRYYVRDKETLVWAQDGPDVQLKLYLNQAAPLGIAEAVAAGAEVNLKPYPGASEYAAAHRALSTRDFDLAAAQLELVLKQRRAAASLKVNARLVLGMVLAARGVGRLAAEPQAGRADLKRAAELYPALAPEIDARLKAAP